MPRTLLTQLHQHFHHTNIEDKVDQVVCMIFRIIESELELLFLQRAYSQDDHYSGDVCFPGGYREVGEGCLAAAIRETQEETGMKLGEGNYIGALEFTFTTRVAVSRVRGNGKDSMQLYMGILMFEVDYQLSTTLTLNPKQIRSSKWVNINHFLQGTPQNLTTWPQPYRLKPDKQLIVLFPAYLIGMDRQLYGLTLYTMMLFVATVEEMIRKNKELNVRICPHFWERFRGHCTDLRVEGGEEDLRLARKLYLENRVGFLRPRL